MMGRPIGQATPTVEELEDRIEKLESENRIFRSTELVDDTVWDALLEQVRQSKAQLENTINRAMENQDKLQAQLEKVRECCRETSNDWAPEQPPYAAQDLIERIEEVLK